MLRIEIHQQGSVHLSQTYDSLVDKLLCMPVDYQEIVDNANFMKNQTGIMLIREPFLLDDELRERCIRWVEWANSVDPSEYHNGGMAAKTS